MADAGNVLPTEPSGITPPSAPPKYSMFRGPNGIRAGWRLLIFLILVAGLFLVAGAIFRLFHFETRFASTTLTPLGLSLAEGTIFLFTSIAAVVMARIERRHYRDYGLPLRPAFRKNFWIGAFSGFLAITATLFAILVLHGFHIKGLAIHGQSIVSATLAWTLTFIIVGLSEEFAFRGYPQFTLTTGMGFWPSAFLLSILFGLAHVGNPGETKFGLFSVVLFGLLFCLFLRRTGNLWWAVGFHAGWDWGQTFFYGVPDSGIPPYHSLFSSAFAGPAWLTGGTVGPEASIFTPIVLAIVAALFSSAYRQNYYEPLQSGVRSQ